MADVTIKIKTELEDSVSQRLEPIKNSLNELNETQNKPSSQNQGNSNNETSQKKQPLQANLYTQENETFLRQTNTIIGALGMFGKALENPISILGTLKDGLFSLSRNTASKADEMRLKELEEEKKKQASKETETTQQQKQQAEKQETLLEQKTSDILNSAGSSETTQQQGLGASSGGLSKALAGSAKGMAGFAGAVGLAVIAIKGFDKALKMVNQFTLAEGQRLANLQTTGNTAGAKLDAYNNSFRGAFFNTIPILGEFLKTNMTKDVANWTAYQPFAKNIPMLLDYAYSTDSRNAKGSIRSSDDIASKVTNETGLNTGYDFNTRFNVMRQLSEFVGSGKDAKNANELLVNSRVFGLDPSSLVSLAGSQLRYNKDSSVNDIMKNTVKIGMSTGLSKERYKELLQGLDAILKRQIEKGVPVNVKDVAAVSSVLGQAGGEKWQGEFGLKVQQNINESLANSIHLASDEDVALYQYTKSENQSYHDWALEIEKGLTLDNLKRLAPRFLAEVGNDETTANIRLQNMFGLDSYNKANDLRLLLEKINVNGVPSVSDEEAEAELKKMQADMIEKRQPQELSYLIKINEVMETTQNEVTSRLDSILENIVEARKEKLTKENNEIIRNIKKEAGVGGYLGQNMKRVKLYDIFSDTNDDGTKKEKYFDFKKYKMSFDTNNDKKLDLKETENLNKALLEIERLVNIIDNTTNKQEEELQNIRTFLNEGVTMN